MKPFKIHIFIILFILINFVLVWIYAGIYFYDFSDEIILNPERGLFAWGPLEDGTNYTQLKNSGLTICYGLILLEGYNYTTIPQTRLNEISNAFSRLRNAGMKCFVRISYTEEADGEDTNLIWAETHLQQLEPIFEANKDVIAWFEAGIIGAWGEWHSSSNGLDNTAGRKAVMNLLLQYLPEYKFISVRTPMYKWAIFDDQELTEEDAFTNTGIARVGHHNDCFLASETDMGTYPSDAIELWKSRVENDTQWVPLGGETCSHSPRANCVTALEEMERLHWTYLNRDYHPDVINDLSTCWDEIQKRLGYRFELISATLPDAIEPSQPFNITINLQNTGYATMYNKRPVFLRIFSDSTVIENIELVDVDPRRWSPDGLIQINETVNAPSIIPFSDVSLALWMPDNDENLRTKPEHSVHFANVGVWDESMGHNILANSIAVGSPSTPSIIIDGFFSDWLSMYQLDVVPNYVELIGDAISHPDIVDIWATNDADYLYVSISFTNTLSITTPREGCIIFIDTDTNTSTGYSSGGFEKMLYFEGSETVPIFGYYTHQGGWWNWTLNMNGVMETDLALGTVNVFDDRLEARLSRIWLGDTAEFDQSRIAIASLSNWDPVDKAPPYDSGYTGYEYTYKTASYIINWHLY